MSTPKNSSRPVSRNEAKWGAALWNAGWTGLPNIILEYQHRLGLDAVDFNIIMQIASHWWEPDKKPFPSKKKMAIRMNVNESTIRRHIAGMQHGNLIRREQRRTKKGGNSELSGTNIYHLDGLIKAATAFVYEKKQDIAASQAARDARAKRKGRAKLHVVK